MKRKASKPRIGPMVDGEDLLHGADKGGVLLGWNAPLFF